MESRMDRYDTETSNVRESRSSRNKELYQRLNDVSAFSTYTNVDDNNVVVLEATSKNYRTREGYQKIRDYSDLVPQPKMKKELEDFNQLYKNRENKVYDINSVIEEAKKNRKEKDELEEKRRLKNTSYNILASLDKEKLEEFKKNHRKIIRADEEDLKEIINTITMKAINGEIDQETSVNLLSDLMATQAMDMVDPISESEKDVNSITVENDISKEVLSASDLKLVEEKKKEEDLKDQKYQEKNQSKNIFKDMDQSFYTKSMDLSDKDFDVDDDEEEEKKKHVGIKIFLLILVLALMAFAVYYFVIKKGIITL